MYQNKRILAIIPARAGSKGVPGKNHLPLAGFPLVEWTFQAAKTAGLFDEIICSTDDEEVIVSAQKENISILRRPISLAQDTTPMLEVILDVLSKLEKKNKEFDYIVLLQPTSPLRTSKDIVSAVKQAILSDVDCAASVTSVPIRPGLLLVGKETNGVLYTSSLTKELADIRRQEAPKLYVVNGAVYVYKRGFLQQGAKLNAPDLGILLPKSHTLDIDTWQDFKRCEKALLRRNQRGS